MLQIKTCEHRNMIRGYLVMVVPNFLGGSAGTSQADDGADRDP
jgi:hypothetical protein